MKIAIIGTRGIPNAYGGFEQFAEYLATGLAARGHELTVYVPHFHAYREPAFQGVALRRKFSPERYLGGAANLIYYYLCLKDAVRTGQEVLLACGPGAVAPTRVMTGLGACRLVTNMDGIEWRRAKWNRATRRLVRWMETWAATRSHALVADNLGIRSHLQDTYQVASTFIPYGADVIGPVAPAPLASLGLEPGAYAMLIARLEPENNIEMILDGCALAASPSPFLVVGNAGTRYGAQLRARYKDHPGIRFLGGIYDKALLDVLRQHAALYCHGHSVGGTNPSLLEAMACGARIAAHENAFNRSVTGEGAAYFASAQDVASLLAGGAQGDWHVMAERNRERIRADYTWASIVDQYEQLFQHVLAPTSAS